MVDNNRWRFRFVRYSVVCLRRVTYLSSHSHDSLLRHPLNPVRHHRLSARSSSVAPSHLHISHRVIIACHRVLISNLHNAAPPKSNSESVLFPSLCRRLLRVLHLQSCSPLRSSCCPSLFGALAACSGCSGVWAAANFYIALRVVVPFAQRSPVVYRVDTPSSFIVSSSCHNVIEPVDVQLPIISASILSRRYFDLPSRRGTLFHVGVL